MSKVIGIDLGTSNSCVAVMNNGAPEIITNAEGSRTTPSVVAFTKTGERLVGQAAKRQAVTNPANTIFSAKRLIGRKFDEIKAEVCALPYQVVKNKSGDAYIRVTDGSEQQEYAPEFISSIVLSKLKVDAEAFLGESVKQAVITVPAYFNDSQRQATKTAGEIAGLEVLRIVNEPTAASLAYGLNKQDNQTVAVYDLGGGTYDVSILEIGDGVFEVLSTNGDTQLGGDNWDECLIKHLINLFEQDTGIDITNDSQAMQRLKEEAEKAKIALSSSTSTDINIPFITADASGPKHMSVELSRAKFEQISNELYERTKQPFTSCLQDADLQSEQVDNLILVGGMTRNTKVIEVAKQLSGGKDPHQGVNPDEVVAAGAAIQGAILSGDESVSDVLLLDVTPLTLGIETAGGVSTAMIERNTTIPAKKAQIFSTAADNQSSVDIVILQGERAMSADNKKIGTFRLDGIAPARRGTPQIEVAFDIDANGILNVTATDKQTGKDQKITITDASGLDKEQVEKMKADAEKHAEADAKKKQDIESTNQLENVSYQMQKFADDNKDKLTEQLLKETETLKTRCDQALSDKQLEQYEDLVKQIQQHSQVLGEHLSSQQTQPTQDEDKHNKRNDAEDADFEVMGEDD